MRYICGVIVFTFILALSSCQSTANVPQSIPQNIPQNDSAVQWQRMKECAERADRLVSSEKLTAVNGVLGVQNHYSQKFGRCFMQISMRNAEAEKNRDLPMFYYELWDAFEQKRWPFAPICLQRETECFAALWTKRTFATAMFAARSSKNV